MSFTAISQVRRIPDGRPAICNLTTILKDLAGPLERQLPEGVGFALRADGDLWVEAWDRDLARFVWELVARVVDGLPQEVGVATVDARPVAVTDIDARVLGLRRSGPYVSLEISHTADHLDLGDFALQVKMMRGRLDSQANAKVGGSVRVLLPAAGPTAP